MKYPFPFSIKTGTYLALFIICFCTFHANAQYYNNAFGKNGTVLKTALHDIIDNHTVIAYSDLWGAFYTTDDKGSIVWDIYSDIPGGAAPYTFSFGTNQCGTYNSEGDCYNREHTWPSTFFGGVQPMYTDLNQIFPTDGFVNNKRGNFPYGKVNTVSWTSDNGSKTGSSSTYPGYTFDVFEPIDSFKGDLARVYFYMSTRYQGEDAGWSNWEMANGAALTNNAVTLLLNWHHLDPVSQKEIERNNEVFSIQGNRNPFIDYPIFADCIWGTADCSSVGIDEVNITPAILVYPNPINTICKIQHEADLKLISYSLINILGEKVKADIVINDEINLSTTPKGVYILQLITSEGRLSKLLIKE